MEITKKTYIRQTDKADAPLRLENLMKIAAEFHNKNWSEMVIQSIIHRFDLDPDTLAPRSGKLRDHCRKPSSK
jgi:hypothetical protein